MTTNQFGLCNTPRNNCSNLKSKSPCSSAPAAQPLSPDVCAAGAILYCERRDISLERAQSWPRRSPQHLRNILLSLLNRWHMAGTTRRTRGRPNAVGATQSTPTTQLLVSADGIHDKENQQSQQHTAQANQPASAAAPVEGRRVGKRRLQPTAAIDPEIFQNLRPSEEPRTTPDHGQAYFGPADEDGEREQDIEDILQEEGLGSDEYVERARRGTRQRRVRQVERAADTGMSEVGATQVESQARQAPTSTPTLVATPRTPAHALSGDLTGSTLGEAHRFPLSPSYLATPLRSASSTLRLRLPQTPSLQQRPGTSVMFQALHSFNTSSTLPGPLYTISSNKRTAADADLGDIRPERPMPVPRVPVETIREAVRRAKKMIANNSRKRYKHYADNGDVYKLMRKTGDLIQVSISVTNPFPPEKYTLTEADRKLLRQEDGGMRSHVQRLAHDLVPATHGIHTAPTESQAEANITRVKHLLDDSRFHHEVRSDSPYYPTKSCHGAGPAACIANCSLLAVSANPITGEGRFQHPLIKQMIHKIWFGHNNALGCVYEGFNPIPHSMIALVMSCVRHALSAYEKTGWSQKTDFTGEEYAKYDQYMGSLAQFDAGLMRELWRSYRYDMYTTGLHNGGLSKPKREEPIIQLAGEDQMAPELALMRAKTMSASGDSSSAGSPSAGSSSDPFMGYRLLVTGPSSVLAKPGQQITNRSSLWNRTRVAPEYVAYVASLIYFLIDDKAQWGEDIGGVGQSLWEWIVEYLEREQSEADDMDLAEVEEDAEDPLTENLMSWWNRQVYGTPYGDHHAMVADALGEDEVDADEPNTVREVALTTRAEQRRALREERNHKRHRASSQTQSPHRSVNAQPVQARKLPQPPSDHSDDEQMIEHAGPSQLPSRRVRSDHEDEDEDQQPRRPQKRRSNVSRGSEAPASEKDEEEGPFLRTNDDETSALHAALLSRVPDDNDDDMYA
ncbi:hypothetical protein C8Q76DRAFT_790691 [Earliella scabrosa]|nr:hypothetical protein C8Q76DRAFT_790691 [Earliella scabrosa]